MGSKKNRKFLVGVGAAAAILAAGATVSHAKNEWEERTGTEFKTGSEVLDALLMENNQNHADNVQLAGHSSHSSHGSHGSHSSHSSGY